MPRPAILITSALALATGINALPADNATTYFAGLFQTLQTNNFTTLSLALAKVYATPPGQSFVKSLYSDFNFTLYAPTNEAFAAASFDPNTVDPAVTLEVLEYHLIAASLPTSNIAAPRDHNIVSTFYHNQTSPSSSSTGNLPGNQTAPLVVEHAPDSANGSVLIRGDQWNVTVPATGVEYRNVAVFPIDQVIPFPDSLSKTLNTSLVIAAPLGLTAIKTALDTLSLTAALDNATGITAFLPVDAAVQALNGTFPTDAGAATNVLLNHIINGTVYYSPLLNPGTYTSASGETLTFLTNSSGAYIQSANVTALILRSDVPLTNGVLHIIDSVLFNTDTDSTAASAAAASASAAVAAATGTTTTAVIGVATTTTGTATETASATGSGAASGAASNLIARGQLVALGLTSVITGLAALGMF